jgi:bacterioferritin (cytochrome b1)
MKKTSGHEVVEDLHRLMAEELEAFLRYFQLRFRLRGTELLAAETFFEKAMEETLEHAQAIAKHIRVLGHTPHININLEIDGGPLRLKDALQEALTFEQQALDAYKEFLPRVTGNTALEDFVRQQIATESEHVQEIAILVE